MMERDPQIPWWGYVAAFVLLSAAAAAGVTLVFALAATATLNGAP